jgi:DNA-binding MarR family transcriptional regulator
VSAHASGAQSDRSIAAPADEPDYRLIELMFFGYRDFVAEADRILESYGFGRAHHRVLHFVNRNPGLTVARLLDILGITKQALARVLKDLIEGGLIEQLSGDTDRRQRLLSATSRGAGLATDLAAAQTRRIRRALEAAGPAHRAAIETYLLGLVEADERAAVSALARPPSTGLR